MEVSIPIIKVITRSPKRSSNGSPSQHRSKRGTAQPCATSDFMEKLIEEAKKTLKYTTQSGEAK